MVELEQQIAGWVDAQVDGIEPVAPDEAIGLAHHRALAPPALPRGRRLAPIGLVAAAVLLVGALAVATSRDRSRPDVVRAGTTTTATTATPVPDDWERSEVEGLGWTFERPARARVQTWADRCATITAGDGTERSVQDTGTLVTLGVQGAIRFDESMACSTAWDPEDLAVSSIVALSLSHHVGGPFTRAERADTPTPLALDDLSPTSDAASTAPAGRAAQIVVDGDHRYSVRTWIGADADPADVAALERMVGSIRWGAEADRSPIDDEPTSTAVAAPATGSSRMTTFIACMTDADFHPYLAGSPFGRIDGEVGARLTWPAGEQDRPGYQESYDACNEAAAQSQRRISGNRPVWPIWAGPSQTPAEAQRDGVVPALAEHPLADRAVPARWFDRPEGTWAITTMPARPTAEDCIVGEPQGAARAGYGADWICSVEYGEVVLVDARGRLLRAFPMPGAIPTWILPTKDAIYVGHLGDGGLPVPVIGRIDRETFEAEFLTFPSPDGTIGSDLPGWSAAPDGASYSDLVVQGDDGSGMLVDSTVGITSVRLPAIEELFA